MQSGDADLGGRITSYTYDANGNRRHGIANYNSPTGLPGQVDYWR